MFDMPVYRSRISDAIIEKGEERKGGGGRGRGRRRRFVGGGLITLVKRDVCALTVAGNVVSGGVESMEKRSEGPGSDEGEGAELKVVL